MKDKIRICKIMTRTQTRDKWGPIHKELLVEIADEGVEITEVDWCEASITAINSSYEADLVAPARVQAALRAEREGYDAVVMGCLLEPGISAAKEALRIPVVGDLGASLHLASLVARKFSILVPGAKRGGEERALGDLVRQYGFSDHVASFRRVGATTLDFAETAMQESVIALMLVAATAAVEEDGAQAIIGYGGLSGIRALRQNLPVPVVSPIQASVIVAGMLVRARLSQSKVAFPYPMALQAVEPPGASAHSASQRNG